VFIKAQDADVDVDEADESMHVDEAEAFTIAADRQARSTFSSAIGRLRKVNGIIYDI